MQIEGYPFGRPSTVIFPSGRLSGRPALLYHSRGAGGNGKSWEFAIFAIAKIIAILDCSVAFCGADAAKSLQI